jgi:hypothetical protein
MMILQHSHTHSSMVNKAFTQEVMPMILSLNLMKHCLLPQWWPNPLLSKMETKTNSFSRKAHKGHHVNKLQKSLFIANESTSMTLTSTFKPYATLIVHPSLSGILLIMNPLSVQPLEELHVVLHVVSRFLSVSANTLRDLPLRGSLTIFLQGGVLHA